MPPAELLIYHHLPNSGGTTPLAVIRENYGPGEIAELYHDVAELQRQPVVDRAAKEAAWYQAWYRSLPTAEKKRIKCVASHTANQLMPALDRPFRAICVLRDPVEYVWSLYNSLRSEWPDGDLADIYRELGGGGPRSSDLHDRCRNFFNGQARSILVPWHDPTKLEYWAGLPDRGMALRDQALELLDRHYVVGVNEQLGASLERFGAAFSWGHTSAPSLNESDSHGQPDPPTRSLILAHNQLDSELHARSTAMIQIDRQRPRRRKATPQRTGAICVLGSPRSGTSLTARILNILGVELGPQSELMSPAANNNRAGFWEHEGIANLNEEILASLSQVQSPYLQGWRWPPSLDKGWEQNPLLEPHRRAAGSILRKSFSGESLWGWKDPRTSLTLAFWQRLVPEMRYVICVRDPLDVSASLAARDRMPPDESLWLWLRYMSKAVLETSGQPRLLVSYETYFSDRGGQVERLAHFLGQPQPSAEQHKAINHHLDQRLWHHRREQQGAPATVEPGPFAEADELHAVLRAFCASDFASTPATEATLDAAAHKAADLLAHT